MLELELERAPLLEDPVAGPTGFQRASTHAGWPLDGAGRMLGDALLPSRCLAAILDEIDYGTVLLLERGRRVASVNHAARVELDDEHPLRICEGSLEARSATDHAALRQAIDDASLNGRRRLLNVGTGTRRLSLAVVPLLADEVPGSVLVVLGKRAVCESLSIVAFCQSRGITSAETRVLVELSAGAAPKQIARRLGVALSTVRTHIINLRAKSETSSIGALLAHVALLPPLRSALRASGRQPMRAGAGS